MRHSRTGFSNTRQHKTKQIHCPETTGLLSQAGWSLPEYKAWLLTTLAQQLLQRPKLARSAYSDLSYAP